MKQIKWTLEAMQQFCNENNLNVKVLKNYRIDKGYQKVLYAFHDIKSKYKELSFNTTAVDPTALNNSNSHQSTEHMLSRFSSGQLLQIIT